MHGLEKVLGKDQESFRLLAAARSVPDFDGSRPVPVAGAAAADPATASTSLGGKAQPSATAAVRARSARIGEAVADAVGDAAAVEVLVKPPASKLADLEERVASGLEGLLRETRAGLDQRRREETLANDEALKGTQRARLDAELGFWRGVRAADLGGEPLAEGELGRLKEQLAACAKGGSKQNAGPPLAELVYDLLDSCRSQHRLARAMDGVIGKDSTATAEGRALAAAEALGDLLLEADRDVEALALALTPEAAQRDGGTVTGAEGASAATELAWAQRLEATARSAEEAIAAPGSAPLPPAPLLDSLAEQLEAENALLRRAVAELRARQKAGPS